ncbi:GtrA family protein [Solirubrobacter phytolaccae]|uniref:GtrA family protein n=1 Tax=Solirubrobacter phytolaccae TaxID=1404360 RepID=A0A9X3S8M8_9ACTN|nr:GtrA family protein [Solirubrobacter phytolaccae]MDA0182389.1 GtrA family protein [Solirubrobacter phytolaccae]
MKLLRVLMAPRAEPLRFAIVGGLAAVTYFVLSLGLATAGLAIQLAMVIAYPAALLVHFSGQRWFAFASAEGFALAWRQQAGRYITIGVIQLALSLLITTFVPSLIGVDERIVYAVATVALTTATYILLRLHVFHSPTLGHVD